MYAYIYACMHAYIQIDRQTNRQTQSIAVHLKACVCWGKTRLPWVDTDTDNTNKNTHVR